MSAQEQDSQISIGLYSLPAGVELSIIAGDGDQSGPTLDYENYIGVTGVEVHESNEDASHRVETITLRNGRRYTCTVTEADPEYIPDIGGVDLTLLVDGFTEIASVRNSTASNRHKEAASRRKKTRTVSPDRLGYSVHSPARSLGEAVRTARHSKEEAASDLLEVGLHYSEGNPTTILATSAGFDLTIEALKQNKKDPTRPELNIDTVRALVACAVAKNEQQHGVSFRPEESPHITRALTIGRFGVHCALNLAETAFHNPLGIWDSRGIITALGRRPLMLVMLPIQFAGHTIGTEFVDLVEAAEDYEIILASGGKDPLTARAQYDAVNKCVHSRQPDRPISIDQRIDPSQGHISYPVEVKRALNALGVHGEDGVVVEAEQPNVIELGLRVAVSATEHVASIATTTIGKAGRLGGRVLSPLLGLAA